MSEDRDLAKGKASGKGKGESVDYRGMLLEKIENS